MAEMAPHLALAIAASVEVGALFALWNWPWSRSGIWRGVGLLGAGLFAGLLYLAAPVLTGRIAVGFFGLYIGSGLLWAWWRSGLHPKRWRCGEAIVAALALGLLAVAAA